LSGLRHAISNAFSMSRNTARTCPRVFNLSTVRSWSRAWNWQLNGFGESLTRPLYTRPCFSIYAYRHVSLLETILSIWNQLAVTACLYVTYVISGFKLVFKSGLPQ